MKFIVSTAALCSSLFIAGSALAADLPMAAPPLPAMPAYNWTGLYVGLNAGYAINNSNIKNTDVIYYGSSIFPLDTYRKSKDGSFTGGIQFGYNYQMDNIVVGIETDFNYAGLENKIDYGYAVPGSGTVTVKNELNWFGTLRGRAGFVASDRFLAYATGGLAYGNTKAKMTYNDINAVLTGSKSKTRFGWTVGAGLEYALTDNISVKGEYSYVSLGKQKSSWAPTTINASGSLDYHAMHTTSNNNFHVVRMGVNYKF